MNKKGVFFLPFLTLALIACLLFAYYTLILHNENNPDSEIGDKQYLLYEYYGKAENYLFFIDVSAKYSIEKAIDDLNKNGGFSEDDVWRIGHSPDVKEEFKKSFNKYFNEYMDLSLNEKSAEQRRTLYKQNKNNYDLNFESNILFGKSNKKIVFALSDFNYSINSSFKQKFNYDFTKYDFIKKEIEDLLRCLENKETITDNLIKECKFNRIYNLNNNILTYNVDDIKLKIELGKNKGVASTEWGTSF